MSTFTHVVILKKKGPITLLSLFLPRRTSSYDCSNIIYGQTVNPHNLKKTSGGSSGGEAALIGGGGSILGIGSDIGGSIRIPAAFCGICGLKPTVGRLRSSSFALSALTVRLSLILLRGNKMFSLCLSKVGISSVSPGQKSGEYLFCDRRVEVDRWHLCDLADSYVFFFVVFFYMGLALT